MKNLKSPKMLTIWAETMGFASALSEKCGPSTKWAFLQSSRKSLSKHTKFDFKTCNSGLELGNRSHLLLANISAATPQMPEI
jgi:hypothetical protein